jgi:hypothetical protein
MTAARAVWAIKESQELRGVELIERVEGEDWKEGIYR